MKKFMAMFLMLFFAFVLVGCGNTEQTNGSTGKILIQSNGKTLTVSSIAVNAQVQLKAVDAKTLKEVSVTWTSDKPEAATVDQNGLVTGVATGKGIVVIGAEDKDGNPTNGSTTGCHLHFSIKVNDTAQNPLDYVSIPSD